MQGSMQYENLDGQEPKWKAGCVLAVLAFGVIGFISLIVLVAVEINSRPVPPPLLSQLQAGFLNVPLGKVGFEKDIAVSGGIPAGLWGTLFRNTPQYYQPDNPHWFSGLAAVHSFALNNVTNTMTYKSQYIKSFAYDSAVNQSTVPRDSPNTVVTLWKIASHWLTSTAWTTQNEFDPVTLDTIASPFIYDGDGRANGHLQPEHPHFTTSGDQYNFFADMDVPAAQGYRLFTVKAGTTRRNLVNANALIPFRQTPGGQMPLYQHSFVLTKQYLIMIEQPVEVGGGQFDKYNWHPDWNTWFRVIALETGNEVKSFTFKGLYFFHASNAYECEGNSTINVDIIQYPDASIMPNLFLSVMLNASTNYKTAQSIASAKLWRYQLDMSQASGSPVSAAWQISDANIELPQIHHDRFTGNPYTYVYGAAIQGSSVFFNSLVKINVNTGVAKFWSQSRAFPSEPLFVPNTAIANPKEDDGWLVSVVLDGKSQQSFLLVLNANDMSEACRATLSSVVPFGFHGHFMR